jgi:hypothetical protein
MIIGYYGNSPSGIFDFCDHGFQVVSVAVRHGGNLHLHFFVRVLVVHYEKRIDEIIRRYAGLPNHRSNDVVFPIPSRSHSLFEPWAIPIVPAIQYDQLGISFPKCLRCIGIRPFRCQVNLVITLNIYKPICHIILRVELTLRSLARGAPVTY